MNALSREEESCARRITEEQAASLREAELRAAYDLGYSVGASWLSRLLFELLEIRQSCLSEDITATVRWIADHCTPSEGERIRRARHVLKVVSNGVIEAQRK